MMDGDMYRPRPWRGADIEPFGVAEVPGRVGELEAAGSDTCRSQRAPLLRASEVVAWWRN